MEKLLFVVHTLQVGGAEKVLLNILKNIDKEKYDVTVLALVDDGIYVDKVKEIEGVHYKYIFKAYFKKSRTNKQSRWYKISNNIMGKIWKRYLKKMKYSAKELYEKHVKEEYDVEIAFLEGKVSKFVSYSNNPKSKKIAWIHTDITNSTNSLFIDDKEEKECYGKFNKIVCVSGQVKKKFIEKTGRKKNVIVQVNPMDSVDIIKKSKSKFDAKKEKGVPILCTVGRLVSVKGYDRLLEVHKRIMDEGIRHRIWIVGEGIEHKKLQDYIRKNRLEKSVKLVGYSSNPYKYMKNADVFVCASRVEGLSSVVLEAAILGKVIVSTDCPGTKDILGEDNENGLVVENSTEGLYAGIKEILTNKDLRKKYQKNIKTRGKMFDLKATMEQIENIIDG